MGMFNKIKAIFTGDKNEESSNTDSIKDKGKLEKDYINSEAQEEKAAQQYENVMQKALDLYAEDTKALLDFFEKELDDKSSNNGQKQEKGDDPESFLWNEDYEPGKNEPNDKSSNNGQKPEKDDDPESFLWEEDYELGKNEPNDKNSNNGQRQEKDNDPESFLYGEYEKSGGKETDDQYCLKGKDGIKEHLKKIDAQLAKELENNKGRDI